MILAVEKEDVLLIWRPMSYLQHFENSSNGYPNLALDFIVRVELWCFAHLKKAVLYLFLP